MTGYYKEPDLTREAFTEDGYLHTGDEGAIDKEGYLKITGRVKDLFKSSKGKYIAPSPIEMIMLENEDLEQVCVVGNGIPQPLALAVLTSEFAKRGKEELKERLIGTLKSVNDRLDHHEKLAKIIVLSNNWTVENGMLTPTMKVKRKTVESRYETHYHDWSNESGKVIWN